MSVSTFTAEVVAVCNGLESLPGKSAELIYGDAFVPPVTFVPDEKQADLFTIVDANNDDCTWSYYYGINGRGFRYRNHDVNNADDWLFLPAIKVADAAKMLKFSLEGWSQGEIYTDTFEVMAGLAPTPEAMTTSVLPQCEVIGLEHIPFSGYFDVPAAGDYYIGIHCNSTPDGFVLYLSNFSVELSDINLNGPGAVTGLSVTPGADGALEAKIEFDLPTTNNAGVALQDNVTATVVSEADTKSVTGAPGEHFSMTIATVQGENTLTISTTSGGRDGMITEAKVYTGVVVPGAPNNLKVEMGADNCHYKLTWEPPTEGENGGFVRPTGITYYLCEPMQTAMGTVWDIAGVIGTDVYEYERSVDAGISQTRVDHGILAANEAGTSSMIAIVSFGVGTPHELPVIEDFHDKLLHYSPVILFNPEQTQDGANRVSWALDDPQQYPGIAACPGNTALIGHSDYENHGRIDMPKFSTKGRENVVFAPTLLAGKCRNVRITAETSGVAETEIFDMSQQTLPDGSYNKLQIKLPAQFQNKEWVLIHIYPYFGTDKNLFVMPGYEVRDLVAHDLGVSMSGPAIAYMGEEVTFTATVSNQGLESIMPYDGGVFTLEDANGNVLLEEHSDQIDGGLEPSQFIQETFTITPQIEHGGDVFVTFTLDQTDDYADNDTGRLPVSVLKGNAVVVDNLKGQANADGVNLEWTTPGMGSGNESFEEQVPFVLSGNRIGAMTHVSLDKGVVYNINNQEFKELASQVIGKPGFHVYNGPMMDTAYGMPGLWPASDGDQFLMCFCPGEPQGNPARANDWLISPKVAAGSTFSFDAKCVTTSYGAETLELYYSDKDSDNPDDFTLLKTVEVTADDWESFEATLPMDAVRFAIKYASRDIFGICLDNICYQPLSENLKVKTYDVYRQTDKEKDYKKVGSTPQPGYKDADANVSVRNRYYVIPNLSDGTQGLRSNIANVEPAGIELADGTRAIYGGNGEIVIRGYDSETIVLMTADGRTLGSRKCANISRIHVEPGVYVVKTPDMTVTVIVR